MPNSFDYLTPSTSTSSAGTESALSSATTSLVHQQMPSTILEQDVFDEPTSVTSSAAETFSTPLAHLLTAQINSTGHSSNDEPTNSSSDENNAQQVQQQLLAMLQKSRSSDSSPDSREGYSNDVTSESQMLVTASEGEYSFKNEISNIENTITNVEDVSLNANPQISWVS
jgi:hypothetical protein